MAVFLSDEQDVDVDGDDLVALAQHVVSQRHIPPDMDVSLLLVDRDTIAGLNRRHLHGDSATDVLAFPIDEPGESLPDGPAVLGDVVLCPAVAAEQARPRGVSVQRELRLLTVHGILHLTGMDHAEPADERAMFDLTDELLTSYERGGRRSGIVP